VSCGNGYRQGRSRNEAGSLLVVIPGLEANSVLSEMPSLMVWGGRSGAALVSWSIGAGRADVANAPEKECQERAASVRLNPAF
jgi:hypothetical protein